MNANLTTQEFDGASVGIMTLSEGSNLMQTNGTSSSAASTQAASAAANTVATETAQRESHAKGWRQHLVNETSVDTGRYGSYNDQAAGNSQRHFSTAPTRPMRPKLNTPLKQNGREDQVQGVQSYETAYNENYDSVDSAYSNVITNGASTATGTATGIIKGEFLSTEDSITSIGQEGQLDAVVTSALSAATKTGADSGSESWKAAFNAAYEAGYQQSVGSTSTVSDSQVSIEGLGAIASVNADEKSNFTVNLDRLSAFTATGTQTNSSATANGSSTATLSTNSFATQNNQRTASAFMQAFAAN